ncbi:hypothetical protein GCM10010327_39490 [Streptomyces nitrosporeus]|nr:hypothetical protein GCM10010327_39490 [Streptomyces nitrosporeus]
MLFDGGASGGRQSVEAGADGRHGTSLFHGRGRGRGRKQVGRAVVRALRTGEQPDSRGLRGPCDRCPAGRGFSRVSARRSEEHGPLRVLGVRLPEGEPGDTARGLTLTVRDLKARRSPVRWTNGTGGGNNSGRESARAARAR